MSKIKLDSDEMICSKCHGEGIIVQYSIKNICPKCKGSGKLDWIENIVGKRKRSNLIKYGGYVQEIDFSLVIYRVGLNMRNKTDLNPGDIVCSNCNGTGNSGYTQPDTNMDAHLKICPKCYGAGKLDWIENIVGKTDPFFYFKFKPEYDHFPSGEIMDELVKEASVNLAETIDKKILDNICKSIDYKIK